MRYNTDEEHYRHRYDDDHLIRRGLLIVGGAVLFSHGLFPFFWWVFTGGYQQETAPINQIPAHYRVVTYTPTAMPTPTPTPTCTVTATPNTSPHVLPRALPLLQPPHDATAPITSGHFPLRVTTRCAIPRSARRHTSS